MKCKQCGKVKKDVKKRRQNTAYVEEEENYVVCCEECFEVIEEYWAERWSELYKQL